MSRTFGDYLQHFVLSVDIVDKEIREAILNQIKNYLSQELGVVFIIFHIETKVDQQPGLTTTEWHTGGEKRVITIKGENDRYKAQVALAFDLDKPLWIVGDKKEKLIDSDTYNDLWSNIDQNIIPKYSQNTESPSIHSSIIIPAHNSEGKIFGVVNFESERYLEPSPIYQNELNSIVRSLSKLYFRNKTFFEQGKDTRKAIQDLIDLRETRLVTLAKPKIFLASSSDGEPDVLGAIIDLIEEIGSFELVYWRDISENGIINIEILKNIKLCQYGICYLSKKINEDEGKVLYRDNHNVLIELGMIASKSEKFENVIPIREEPSEPTPFDISPVRTITVPRTGNKRQINMEKFKMSLRNQLENWSD